MNQSSEQVMSVVIPWVLIPENVLPHPDFVVGNGASDSGATDSGDGDDVNY